MTESLLNRCVMVFVLCLSTLLLFLQLASSPSGQQIPAAVVASSMIGAMCVIAIATLVSSRAGWNKLVVKVVGVLFALLAIWLLCDRPPDLRTALLDVGLGTVLLATSFRGTTGTPRTDSGQRDDVPWVSRDP